MHLYFLLKKKREAVLPSKASHIFFQLKMAGLLCTIRLKLNISLAKDFVSFKQLSRGWLYYTLIQTEAVLVFKLKWHLIRQGPVVQSIVSLTSSLRGQLKGFTTLQPYALIFFVEEMRKAFALQKLLTFF